MGIVGNTNMRTHNCFFINAPGGTGKTYLLNVCYLNYYFVQIII